MITFTLSSGDKIPALGLGTWKAEPSIVGNTVKLAIKAGYKHIDCASIYLNEDEIGEALQWSTQNKLVLREDLWITSKLWNSYHAYKDVEPALKNTLTNLRVDYLDLYLIHWPVAFKSHVGIDMPRSGTDFIPWNENMLRETWEAMEALVEKGLVKNIGISNFSKTKIQSLLKNSKIKPTVNQIECHPFLLQNELAMFCKNENIHITGYSPLGSNALALLKNDVILKIANKHHATPAQIVLAWQIQRGNSVIPKSTNEQRITENLMSLDVKLTDEDIKNIDSLDQNKRALDGRFWEIDNSPYTADELWK